MKPRDDDTVKWLRPPRSSDPSWRPVANDKEQVVYDRPTLAMVFLMGVIIGWLMAIVVLWRAV